MLESTTFDPAKSLILAVDDVVANLKVLRGLLFPVGYKVTFATGGQQVLERVQWIKPDLILLDLMMPEMSGLDVCKLLKQSPETTYIPIIFLTASHELDDLVLAFEHGAVDYITKPFNAAELLARVRTHLELSQLRKQAQTQAALEVILRQIVQDMHGSINLQDILDTTVQNVQGFLDADRVMVYRCENSMQCELMAIKGNVPETILADHQTDLTTPTSPIHIPFNLTTTPVSGQRLSQAELSHLSAEDKGWLQTWHAKLELRTPLFQDKQLWGALLVQHDRFPMAWMQGELAMLQLITQQLAISIQQAELHQQLQIANQELKRLSNTDSLTQVGNRRRFDHTLAQEWRRAQREQQPLALILCDIDYFKQYNDTYGHPSGDTCLVAVAKTLEQCLKRPADCLARYGGEEFAAILPNTDIQGALDVIREMQAAIASLNIQHDTHAFTNRVTLSFGLATIDPQHPTTIQALLNQADQALYQAKKDGRDRTSIVTPNAR